MFLGIEIGGTKLQLGVGRGDGGDLLALERRDVDPVRGAAGILEQIESTAAGLMQKHVVSRIGVGFGGYGPFVSPLPFSKPDAGWPIVNNETIELLAETGVVGLTAFVVFLAAVFWSARGRKDAVTVACVAALLGMLAQYQTFSTLYIMHVWFTVGLLLTSSKPGRA